MDPAVRAELVALRGTLTAALTQIERMLAVPANDDLPATPAPEREPAEAWFVRYVSECEAQGRRPSREDDLRSMREAGFSPKRPEARALRLRFAPAAWHVPGPRGR